MRYTRVVYEWCFFQVIIRYEMSPLVRISGQKKVWTAVQWKVVEMLSTRPDGKIKLLE